MNKTIYEYNDFRAYLEAWWLVAGHFKVIHPWTLESDSPVDRG